MILITKLWKIFIAVGLLMLISAVGLCVYNVNESNEAYEKSQTALVELKDLIPDLPEKPEQTYTEHLYEIQEHVRRDVLAESEERMKENSTPEMQTIQLDGRYYCGYITLNTLGIELPVLNNWSYANLNIAPCRYEGTPETNDFIVIAHNYNSHFGRIKNLAEVDDIIFTDCNGEKYHYVVSYIEYIDGFSVEQMSENGGAWDMTLFTCTLNGQTRVTVRCKLR